MTTQLSAAHISRLIILKHHLVERGPDRFAMAYWFTKSDNAEQVETCDWWELTHQPDELRQLIERPEALSCGTAACLAGHALTVWPGSLHGSQVIDVARWLGMDVEAPGDSTEWFAVGNWPLRFRAPRKELALDWSVRIVQDPYEHERYADMEHECERELNAFDHSCIVDMLDDLIHGRRLHWWDESTAAADRADLMDAQP